MNIKAWQKAGILGGLLMAGACWIAYADAVTAAPGPQAKAVIFPLDIKFDTDKADIKPGQHNDAEFKKLTSELNNYPYARVEIEGYADATGPEAFNQKLSEQRAQAVRQRFIDHYGIASERIKAVGFGEMKPVATNATVQGRTQNRRVIARIIRLESEKIQSNGNHL
jgi:outer membrane protein OmpA-like peptidoglycan-associated protein